MARIGGRVVCGAQSVLAAQDDQEVEGGGVGEPRHHEVDELLGGALEVERRADAVGRLVEPREALLAGRRPVGRR